ncbi:acyl carrier protein, partial [Nocardia abscessus]|uniref:acyl carrier protein n=1 Tax=Nocardia abscessus TaxID=120957 RepID=UPI003CC7F7B8
MEAEQRLSSASGTQRKHHVERGGNSLLATRLAARLSTALGEQIPVLWLFAAPTPARLVAQLEQHR